DQILGLFIGHRQANNVVGAAKKVFEGQMLYSSVVHGCDWIGHENFHAQRYADRSEVLTDVAVTNDTKTAAGKLPPHHDLRSLSGMIICRRSRNSARQVDQIPERKFRHRLHEAGPGSRDQYAHRGSRPDINIADI